MRIKSAHFENIALLKSGLGRNIVDIDMTDMTNIITLFIGEMGTGKTTILGHLQPWAGFGILDERNSENIVLAEKDGLKNIIFEDGSVEYDVTHKWTWTKDHHSLKSYIKKNGAELNPNGNISSFKEIVESELGIDQNYLRLIRIGPNVSNIIELSSTERKTYFSQLLSQTDIYLTILKYMKEQSKTLTAQSQLLSKHLGSITESDIEDMKSRIKSIKKELDHKAGKHEKLMKEKLALSSKLGAVFGKDASSVGELRNQIELDKVKSVKLTDEINALYDKIDMLKNKYGSDKSINREIGKCEADLVNNARLITGFETGLEDLNDELSKLNKLKLSCGDPSHIEDLRAMYVEYLNTIEGLRKDLVDFKCPFSTTEVKLLINDLQTATDMIAQTIEYDPKSVKQMLTGDKSVLSFAKNEILRLRGKLIKLQRELSNIDFVRNYDVSENLYDPKCGKHEGCPYYRTHPNTVKTVIDELGITKQRKEINDKIDDINAKIEGYTVYPAMFNAVQNAHNTFRDTAPKLTKLGVCLCDSFYVMMTNPGKRAWYDMDALMNIYELCEKRERLSVMESKLSSIKAEIDMYNTNNIDDIMGRIERVKKDIAEVKSNIVKIEEFNKEAITRRKELEDNLVELINIDSLNVKFNDMLKSKEDLLKHIDEMTLNLIEAEKLSDEISEIDEKAEEIVGDSNELRRELEVISRRVDDYNSTKTELNGLLDKLSLINLIKDASSPKEGIPLIYVKMFLDDCVDTINEMVSMVFDDIEILGFDIEHDFAIPYRKGDLVMKDVRSASQGERAIFSLALSFALMRKGVSKYNILLLDEVDGPLHSDDRDKFLLILSQQIQAIGAEQVFLITHNNIFEGYPVNIILTSHEIIDKKCPQILLSS